MSEPRDPVDPPDGPFAPPPQASPFPPLPGEQGNTLGWDDVMIFPTLRNLGMVRGLQFPPALRRYVDEVTRLSGVPSYFERAC